VIFASDIAGATAPLTPEKALVLIMAVRKYKPYADAPVRYPNLEININNQTSMAYASVPDGQVPYTILYAKALDAIHTKLLAVGDEEIAKEGGDSAIYYSVRPNWNELLGDVLSLLYRSPSPTGPRQFGLVQRGPSCGPDLSPIFCRSCMVYWPCSCRTIIVA
jgi:hypothetical protein